jgi:adenosylcobyric acid synthase
MAALLRWAGLDGVKPVDAALLREQSLDRIADAALPLPEALAHPTRREKSSPTP